MAFKDDGTAPLMINVGSDGDDQILRKLVILVCTSADEFNVKAFILLMAERYRSLIKEVRYFRLPYNDLDKFSFTRADAKADVIVLCHSIHNRRLAITDVMDALYDRFLPHAARVVGRENVCVLAHDLPWENIESAAKYHDVMSSFRLKQPSTFQHSSLAMIGGKLGEAEVQLSEENLNELRDFVYDAATRPVQPSSYDHYKEVVISLAKSLWASIRMSCRSWTGKVLWAIIAILLIVVIFSIVVSHDDQAPNTVIVPATNTTPSHSSADVSSTVRRHIDLHQHNVRVRP